MRLRIIHPPTSPLPPPHTPSPSAVSFTGAGDYKGVYSRAYVPRTETSVESSRQDVEWIFGSAWTAYILARPVYTRGVSRFMAATLIGWTTSSAGAFGSGMEERG